MELEQLFEKTLSNSFLEKKPGLHNAEDNLLALAAANLTDGIFSCFVYEITVSVHQGFIIVVDILSLGHSRIFIMRHMRKSNNTWVVTSCMHIVVIRKKMLLLRKKEILL